MDINGLNNVMGSIQSHNRHDAWVSTAPADYEFTGYVEPVDVTEEAVDEESAEADDEQTLDEPVTSWPSTYDRVRYFDIITHAMPSLVLNALSEDGLLSTEKERDAIYERSPQLKLLGINCSGGVQTLTFEDLADTGL